MSIASTPAKPGRNDPCPCGSGKKYKLCCASRTTPDPERGPTALRPDFSLVLATANRHAAAGDLAGAEDFFRRAVSLKPNDAVALAGLGQCLCWLRRRREGVSYLVRAADRLIRSTRSGDGLQPLLELAEQLQYWREIPAAARLAEHVVRLVPRNVAGHHALALCWSRLHRNEDALEAARTAQRLAPLDPNVNILLAVLERGASDLNGSRTRLEGVLSGQPEPAVAARAHLELGHTLDKLKEYAAAFEAFRTARALEAETPEAKAQDPHLALDRIAANQTGYTADMLRHRAETFVPDGLPIPNFLVGFLRSGTTLTEQVLAAHPEVMTGDETDIVFELSEEVCRIAGPGLDLADKLLRLQPAEISRLRRLFWQRVEDEQGPDALRKTYVDKNALNCAELGLINFLFPEARVIFALRDPRDVVLSCFMQSFGLSVATAQLLSWEGAARFYAAVMDFWLAFRERTSLSYREIRYEDAVRDFRGEYGRLFTHLGLVWHPDVELFHEKARGKLIATPSFADVTRAVYQTSAGRWRSYRNEFAALGDQLDRYIAELGYEPV